MTILELKKQIEDLPDDMEVFIGERLTEEKYGRVNSAQVRIFSFHEDLFEEPVKRLNMFVLSED